MPVRESAPLSVESAIRKVLHPKKIVVRDPRPSLTWFDSIAASDTVTSGKTRAMSSQRSTKVAFVIRTAQQPDMQRFQREMLIFVGNVRCFGRWSVGGICQSDC